MSISQSTRREFLKAAGIASGAALAGCGAAPRPNILWVTCEDLSPVIGCYGDRQAYTPNIDRLAAEGVRFTNAFATAPVCTPARSCLITGIHAVSMGSQNLRGAVPMPAGVPGYTEYLLESGYYCTNNVKEDYNFLDAGAPWDESSKQAHWRNGPGDKPFFSIFNLTITHQSQVRYSAEELEKVNAELAPEERHDPADLVVPPYYPDTPVVRLNLAALYTQVTRMDKQVGGILSQLDEDGLAEDTIVFFYSDHGTGLPRGKRWLHDTGLRVPMVLRFPEKYRHWAPSGPGSTFDDLVSFVDLPPTMLDLTGLNTPDYMQGRSFLGSRAGPPREYVYAARDRVDEVVDIGRTILSDRYQYIRNFTPHRPRMQRSDYSEITPIRQELRRLAAEGKLSGDAAWLMQPSKPAEELYDIETDPNQLVNLADAPEHAETLERMRKALRAWILEVRDTGLLPEPELARRAAGRSPYDMAKSPDEYPLEKILDAADLIGRGAEKRSELEKALSDDDPAVRYWGAAGLVALGSEAAPASEALGALLKDDNAAVRTAAAEALCHLGREADALPVLIELVGSEDGRTALHAAISLVYIGKKARPAIPAIEASVVRGGEPAEHYRYVDWALTAIRSAQPATTLRRQGGG